MLPAGQGLEADDMFVAERDDRLEIGLDLAGFERGAQVGFEHCALAQPRVHLGMEDPVDAAASALALVHRDVGGAQQFGGPGRIDRAARYADRRIGIEPDAVDLERSPQRAHDPPGRADRNILPGGIGKHTGEFVAAEPRQRGFRVAGAADAAATWTSKASPTAWPWTSLTDLN